jgi:hypothetical protein
MTPLFKKLNFREGLAIVALNAPDSMQEELKSMQDSATVITSLARVRSIDFALVFVTKQKEIDQAVEKLAPLLEGDALLWICYPKKTSKKYTCDFNRDTGWDSLGAAALEPVRMVAIDEDWSALRFRKVGFIKSITRRESFALTKEAKQRTTQKGK